VVVARAGVVSTLKVLELPALIVSGPAGEKPSSGSCNFGRLNRAIVYQKIPIAIKAAATAVNTTLTLMASLPSSANSVKF
jgi:hypothetical protein